MGRYLHLYETTSDFEADYNGTAYTEPWVSLTEQSGGVNYNKKPGMPEITYDMQFGDGGEVECDDLGALTCEGLENTAVTYPILVHVLNDPGAELGEENYDFVGTLRFINVVHETWGDVYYWRVYDGSGNNIAVECYCVDGMPTFYIPE
jgi:hypothetical protein